jgi:hypothetical protein
MASFAVSSREIGRIDAPDATDCLASKSQLPCKKMKKRYLNQDINLVCQGETIDIESEEDGWQLGLWLP